jgi:hypothetical protein
MQITNASLEWSPEDCQIWERFLRTQTGSRLLPKLAEIAAPKLLRGGETNDILIRNGELLGFNAAIQTLLDLQIPEKKEEPSTGNYVSLEDDSKWPEDLGPKIPKP